MPFGLIKYIELVERTIHSLPQELFLYRQLGFAGLLAASIQQTNPALQALFGMIFTVIIALEFKRSPLAVAERRHGIVQVRTVV
jgi:hypothetical protein